jgi:hypothetical protein
MLVQVLLEEVVGKVLMKTREILQASNAAAPPVPNFNSI